jgi:tape measure domain-containing protein
MARQVRVEIIGDSRRLRQGFNDAQRDTVKFSSMLGRFSGVAVRAFGGAGVAAAGLGVAAATMGLKTAANLEQAQIAFKHLTGSAAAGKKMLAELNRFAAETPFELPGVEQAAQLLLGAGVAARKVVPDLRSIGDAASVAADPTDAFNRSVLALSQAMNKGKLQGDDLQQVVEAGIPIWKLLSEATGKPIPKLQELSSKGKLLSADVLPKLFTQMHQDYGGAMEEQSHTLSGAWSTFKDNVSNSLAQVMTPLARMLEKTLPAAGKAVSDFVTGTLIPAMKTAKTWWDNNKTAVGELASILGDTFTSSASHADVSIVSLSDKLGGLRGILDRVAWAAAVTTLDFIQFARLAGNVSLRVLDLAVAAGYATNFIDRLQGGTGHAADSMVAWARDMREQTRVQLGGLAEDARHAQSVIDRLEGKTVTFTGKDKVTPVLSQIMAEMKDRGFSVTARLIRGGTAQHGARVPGYGGGDRHPYLLEGGETVVPKELTPEIAPWAQARGIPGFRQGGLVGGHAWPARVNMAASKAALLDRASFGAAAGAPGNVSGVVALGKALAAQMGWVGAQWNALYQLWQHESGWRWDATNPSSGAYGIPQALPASKMGSVASDWRTNPRTQILWGEGYIKGRYNNPGNAWAAWLSRSPHWYGSGMAPTTFSHPTLIGVGEAGPETVSVSPGRGGGDIHYHYHVTVNGAVGGKAEVSQWVRTGIRAVQRHDGVPPAKQIG